MQIQSLHEVSGVPLSWLRVRHCDVTELETKLDYTDRF
jgi:hypothetical protein